MPSFCRIIELPDSEQVLLVKSYDTETDLPKLELTTHFDGAMMTAALGFATDEEMNNLFDNYTLAEAIEFREGLTEMFI